MRSSYVTQHGNRVALLRKVCRYGGILGCCWAAANVYLVAQRRLRRCDASDVQDCEGDHCQHHSAEVPVYPAERPRLDRSGRSTDRCSPRTIGGPGIVCAATICLLILPGFSVISSTWHDIVGAAKTVAGDVKTFVTHAINFAIQGVEQVFRDAEGDIASAVGVLSGLAYQTLGIAEKALAAAGHYVVRGVSDLVGYVDSAVHAAESAAGHALADVRSYVAKGFGAVERWESDFTAEIDRDVKRPLLSILRGLAGEIERITKRGIDEFYHDVLLPVLHDARHVGADIVGAAKWVADVGLHVGRIVLKAESWIVWFGEHTLTDFEHIFDGLNGGLDKSYLIKTFQPSRESIDAVADLIDRTFG
jgi:hypothetical protein